MSIMNDHRSEVDAPIMKVKVHGSRTAATTAAPIPERRVTAPQHHHIYAEEGNMSARLILVAARRVTVTQPRAAYELGVVIRISAHIV